MVIEIEATLNNRPLTYVHDDIEGVSCALTPADLIYVHRVATTPSGRQFDVTSTNKTLTKRAKYQFQMLNNFTKQWQRDYLLSLQERRSIKTTSGVLKPIQIGDVVILQQDGTARCLWKLAKVIETINGRDGVVRAAKVQLMLSSRIDMNASCIVSRNLATNARQIL